MISKDNLVINLQEMVLELQNKQYMNALLRVKDYQLDNIVKILELCQDTILDGTYEEGYESGYERAKDEYDESSYADGWDDCKDEVISILRNYGVTTKDIPDLKDL